MVAWNAVKSTSLDDIQAYWHRDAPSRKKVLFGNFKKHLQRKNQSQNFHAIIFQMPVFNLNLNLLRRYQRSLIYLFGKKSKSQHVRKTMCKKMHGYNYLKIDCMFLKKPDAFRLYINQSLDCYTIHEACFYFDYTYLTYDDCCGILSKTKHSTYTSNIHCTRLALPVRFGEHKSSRKLFSQLK